MFNRMIDATASSRSVIMPDSGRPSADGCPAVQLLHQSRVQAGPAREPEAAAFLGRLRRDKALYTAPFGSNDDWYWIYAAVQAGRLRLLLPTTLPDHPALIA